MKRYTSYIFLVLLLHSPGCDNRKPLLVATLGSESITSTELKHWMLLEKANVYNYFYRKYKVDDSNQFWTQELGGEIPLEKLKAIALEKAKRCKVQQILALEKGVIKTTNFDEIIGEIDGVNEERMEKAEKGEPIYGPVQFTTRTYFSHVFDKLVIELKNELAKKELKPGKEELQLVQEKAGQTSMDNTGFLKMQFADQHYDAYIDELMGAADINVNIDVYDKISFD